MKVEIVITDGYGLLAEVRLGGLTLGVINDFRRDHLYGNFVVSASRNG
jgi:hypothetical protein